MAASDPIADMLTKIRNASMSKIDEVEFSSSKCKLEIVKILKSEGYINSFSIEGEGSKTVIKVQLKYAKDGSPVIRGIEKLSTPGRRLYSGYSEMPRVYNGFGTLVVSTSSGILTGKKAADKKVGGELLCRVW